MEPFNRVYIVNTGGHDVSGAAKYGQFVYLTEHRVNIFATDRLQVELADKLANFNSEKDYVLLCGAIVINVIVMEILRVFCDNINILLYDFRSSTYVVRKLCRTSL